MRKPKKRAAEQANYQETNVLVFHWEGQSADCDLLKPSLGSPSLEMRVYPDKRQEPETISGSWRIKPDFSH